MSKPLDLSKPISVYLAWMSTLGQQAFLKDLCGFVLWEISLTKLLLTQVLIIIQNEQNKVEDHRRGGSFPPLKKIVDQRMEDHLTRSHDFKDDNSMR